MIVTAIGLITLTILVPDGEDLISKVDHKSEINEEQQSEPFQAVFWFQY